MKGVSEREQGAKGILGTEGSRRGRAALQRGQSVEGAGELCMSGFKLGE